MSINQVLLAEFDHEMENTQKILACIPDGKWDWKPHEKSMPLGLLSGHIAEIPSWGVSMMKGDLFELNLQDYKPFIADSSAALIGTFEKYRAEAHDAIAGAADEAFYKIWTMKVNGKTVMSMPRMAVLRSMLMNHLIHHRGQLTVYLRLLNVAFPGMYGPSADQANLMRSGSQSA